MVPKPREEFRVTLAFADERSMQDALTNLLWETFNDGNLVSPFLHNCAPNGTATTLDIFVGSDSSEKIRSLAQRVGAEGIKKVEKT